MFQTTNPKKQSCTRPCWRGISLIQLNFPGVCSSKGATVLVKSWSFEKDMMNKSEFQGHDVHDEHLVLPSSIISWSSIDSGLPVFIKTWCQRCHGIMLDSTCFNLRRWQGNMVQDGAPTHTVDLVLWDYIVIRMCIYIYHHTHVYIYTMTYII